MPMWSFSTDAGWKEIEDFLRTPGVDDCSEEKKLAGFWSHPVLAIGDTEVGSFCVNVHNRSDDPTNLKAPQYQFLASVEIGGELNYVAVPKLPDLLEFLRQTVPLSVSIDEWAIKKEKYNDEIEKQIQSSSSRR